MPTRRKNALAALLLVASLGLCVFALTRSRPPQGGPAAQNTSLDAIPAGALLVAVFDVEALRASAFGPKFLQTERDIPGLGKVNDVCGFDPMARIRTLAVAVPAGGDDGDFGIVAAGDIQDEEILSCAARVIEKRGGRPITTTIGSFRTVRDATMVLTGAEIAVKKGGPILLGAGTYLRAMIDAADGHIPNIRTSVAHSRLAEIVRGEALRATVVLTPRQRDELAKNLTEEGGPRSAAAIVAGALGASIGRNVTLHAVIACENAAACADVAALLSKARDRRAADMATRLVGFGPVLETMTIRAEGEAIQIHAEAPTEEAATLVERLLVLRGARHPMPNPSADPAQAPSAEPAAPSPPPEDAGAPDAMALPAPDVVVTAKGDAGPPPRDAGPGAAGPSDAGR